MITGFLVTFVIAVILAFLSLAMLTYGYGIFRAILPFIAFFYGAIITTSITYSIFKSGVLSFLLAVIVGLVLAFLSSGLYDVFIVLIGASFGWMLIAYLFSLLGIESGFWVTMASLIMAIVVGLYSIIYKASEIIAFVVTSAIGATMLVITVFMVTNKSGLDAITLQLIWDTITSSGFWLILWLSSLIFGVVSQFTSRIYNG